MQIEIPDDFNKLKIYLFVNSLSADDMAKEIDYCKSTINNYTRGATRIGRRLAKAISQYTKGHISVKELLEQNPPIKKELVKKSVELLEDVI